MEISHYSDYLSRESVCLLTEEFPFHLFIYTISHDIWVNIVLCEVVLLKISFIFIYLFCKG